MAKKPPSNTESPSTVLEELTAAQVKELEASRHREEEARLHAEAEKIRQIREEEAQKGKKKVVEKISIEDAPVVMEEKKQGLPERIKKLPKDHPERILFEKGYNARQHKDGNKAIQRKRHFSPVISKMFILDVLIFLAAVGGLYYGAIRYAVAVDDTRDAIVKILKQKHYSINDPKISEDFLYLHTVNWLPKLYALYSTAKSLDINYDAFEDNPEEGTYLDYIRRHNKPFDEREAMVWRVREVRKPSKGRSQ